MIQKELYDRSIGIIAVPATTHSTLRGIDLRPGGFPFRQLSEDEECLFVVADPAIYQAENATPTSSYYGLQRISDLHQRSFEITGEIEGQLLNGVLWQDEYENWSTASSEKGIDASQIEIIKSDISPLGFLVRGLQDSDCLERMVRASLLLRSLRMDTERITSFQVPQLIPFEGKLLPLPLFKDALKKVVQKNGVAPNIDAPKKKKLTAQGLQAVEKYLDQAVFVKTRRESFVSERVGDFLHAQTLEDFHEILTKVFKKLNIIQHRKIRELQLQGLENDPEKAYDAALFDITNEADIKRYFDFYLPKKIMTSFGKMHNAGLLHKYAHPGNIFASGGIADLDSVVGPALEMGDPQVTFAAQLSEAVDIVYDYCNVVLQLTTRGWLNYPLQVFTQQDGLVSLGSENIRELFGDMLCWYMEKCVTHKLDIIKRGLENKRFHTILYEAIAWNDPEELDQLVESLASELGWRYTCELRPVDIFRTLPISKNIQKENEEEFVAEFYREWLKDPESIYDELVEYADKVVEKDVKVKCAAELKKLKKTHGLAVTQMIQHLFEMQTRHHFLDPLISSYHKDKYPLNVEDYLTEQELAVKNESDRVQQKQLWALMLAKQYGPDQVQEILRAVDEFFDSNLAD